MLESVKGKIGAGFHIEDARPIDPVTLVAEWVVVGQGADGVNGIQVAKNQNARAVATPG